MLYLRTTGIVRNLDQLGRIVLPIELRECLGISTNDGLEIFYDDSTIYLRKYDPACIFCKEAKDTILFNGKYVCKKCKEEIKNANIL